MKLRMCDFFHRRGRKIALTAIVLGCMAARILFAVRFTRPNDLSTLVCAIVYTVVAGALVIGVIVFTRPCNFKSVRNLAVSGLIGACLGIILLCDPMMSATHDYGLGEEGKYIFLSAIIGTVIALVAYFGVQSIRHLPPASQQMAKMPEPSVPPEHDHA